MALLVIDGFENFADTGWSGITSYVAGRNGLAAQVSGSPTTANWNTFDTPIGFILGFAWKVSTYTESIGLHDNSLNNNRQLVLQIDTDGRFKLLRGSTLLGSSSTIFSVNTWNYIEIKLGSSGFNLASSCEVRINQTVEITFTGSTANVSTGFWSSALGRVAFSTNTSANQQIDDLYLCSLSGAIPFNDYLGDVRVEQLLPSAAGASTQWTPSAGANWDAVNEVPPSSADYVSASTSGDRDLYTMTDLTSLTGVVLAVRPAWYLSKSDVGADPPVRGVLRGADGTVKQQAALSSQGTTFVSKFGAIETTTPNGSPWTIAEVNALQVGQEIV